MDDFKYEPSSVAGDADVPLADPPPIPSVEAPVVERPEISAAVAKFQSCRWRALPEDGAFCTHRDVLPFAGKVGFKPDSWCPECAFFKLRRTPKKRDRSEYTY